MNTEQLLEQAQQAVQSSRLDEAERLFLSALQGKPDNAQALLGLGVVAAQQKRFQDAVNRFQQVVNVEPRNVDGWLNMAAILRMTGNLQPAVNAYQEVIKFDEENYKAWEGIGQCLLKAGQSEKAESFFAKAASLGESGATASFIAGKLAFERGAMYEARRHLEQAYHQFPNDVELKLYYIQALANQQAFAEAIRIANEVPEDNPGRELADMFAVSCMSNAGMVEETLEYGHRYLHRWPDKAAHFEAVILKAMHVNGDIEAARQRVAEAVKQWPDSPQIWYQRVQIDSAAITDQELEHISHLIPEQQESDQVLLHFALAQLWGKRKEYDKEIASLHQGNALKRKRVNYKKEQTEAGANWLMSFFSTEKLTRNIVLPEYHGPIPVFILGMPRSGTTLLEQVLSSHADVDAAGESSAINHVLYQLQTELGLASDIAVIEQALEKAVVALREGFAAQVDSYSTGLKFITEKSINNYLYVGLLSLAFPEAHFIWMQRHPVDNCLGCYKQVFAAGQEFTYDLDECAHAFRQFSRLMSYWAVEQNIGILPVRYEELVADTEQQVRKILDFCGLPWDDACLRFHESRRRVTTASVGQVRQGMFTSALGRWKDYGASLQPLKDALIRYGVEWDAL